MRTRARTFRILHLAVLAAVAATPSARAVSLEQADGPQRPDRWKGLSATLDFGPSWRSTKIEGRGSIPNTIGGAAGLTLRAFVHRNFFLGVNSQVELTTQLEGRSGGPIGDWSGTELFPLTPLAGVRLGNVQLAVGYPMYGSLTLLSKASNDEAVKYTKGHFWQGSLFFETETGLFGVQYRTGSFQLETVGSVESTLDPTMKTGNFTILFSLPLGK
jgi:hypothetical protein